MTTHRRDSGLDGLEDEIHRLRRRTQSTQALVRAVLGTSGRLLDAKDVETLCKSALVTAEQMLGLRVAQICVLDSRGSHAAHYALDAVRRAVPTNVGLVAEILRRDDLAVLRGAEIARAADADVDARFLSHRVKAVALLPLWGARQRVIGALMCGTHVAGGFEGNEGVSLRLFGLHVGSALELLQARLDLRHWNAIVNSSQAAILGQDLQGQVTHWNPAAEKLYGYTAQEAIGRSIEFVVPKDNEGELAGIVEQLRARETVQNVETVHRTKDGRLVHVALTVSPIFDAHGAMVGTSAIVRDITAEKAQRDLFFQSVELAPSAVVVVDATGRISLANAEAERLFGYAREELCERSVETLLPPEVGTRHEQYRVLFLETPQKRAMGAGRELWAVDKNGNRIPVEVGLNPIEVGGRPMVLASIVDISERKQRERERQRLLAEAQEAVAARDAFLSIASHELKTPLTALQLTVQGLLRAAKKTSAEGFGERVVEKLVGTNRQVGRLATLIDELLDVSRITAGRLQLGPERTDLDGVLRDVVERFRSDGHAPTIVTPPTRPIWGFWDAMRLDQVFTNLLSNAVKYGDGKPIEVEIGEQGDSVVVAVHDHGHGIDPKDQARIFERFERLVSHRHYGGFGLGLWIVRQLVTAHGGQVAVESRPGDGSTFRVTLPKWHLTAESPGASIVEAPTQRSDVYHLKADAIVQDEDAARGVPRRTSGERRVHLDGEREVADVAPDAPRGRGRN